SVWFGGDTGYRAVPDLPKGTDDYAPEYAHLPHCPAFAQIGALRARLREILLGTPREGYASCCEAVADWDFGERLGDIVAPTLVVAGAEDEAIPAAHTDLLVQSIPGARGAVLEDAAHLANLERPAAFADAALAHLEAA
ncbi:MAG TPA: alpha/beta fold hydrolase, partial [Gaiellaceae bacterium]|nr:alpha/beta fold hydrolase [Gaiellaceae bacterium]